MKFKKIVHFLLTAGKLKSLERTGWVREEMSDPESVAEHTFRVALLARILGDELGVSHDKLTSMAIFHDLAEAIMGDPVTQRGSKQISNHKIDKEEEIAKKIFGEIEGEDLFKLWQEHVAENRPGASRESSLLYQLGKIATAWQALEYELAGADPKKCDEWWDNAWAHVQEPKLKRLLKELEKLRKKP